MTSETMVTGRVRKPIFVNDRRPCFSFSQEEQVKNAGQHQAEMLKESAKRFQTNTGQQMGNQGKKGSRVEAGGQGNRNQGKASAQFSNPNVQQKPQNQKDERLVESRTNQHQSSKNQNRSILCTTIIPNPTKQNPTESKPDSQKLNIRMVESKYSESGEPPSLTNSNQPRKEFIHSTIQQRHVFQTKTSNYTLENMHCVLANSGQKTPTSQSRKTGSGGSGVSSQQKSEVKKNQNSKNIQKQSRSKTEHQQFNQNKSIMSSRPKITQIQSIIVNLPNPLNGNPSNLLLPPMPQIIQQSQQNLTASYMKSSRKSIIKVPSNMDGSGVYMQLTVVNYPRIRPSKDTKN